MASRLYAAIAALAVVASSALAAEQPMPTPPAPSVVPAAALAPEAAAPQAPVAAPETAEKTGRAETPDEAKIREMLRAEARSTDLPPEMAEAVATVESGLDPRAVGGVGEIGLMQILPTTARMLGFSEPLPRLFDPQTNIRYGVRYLSEAWRLTGQDICGTVMKYRAGHGETRFSHKSVAYCVRVREILASKGFKVTGVVPAATFGEPGGRIVAASGRRGVKRLANGRVRMRFNWKTVDLRRKALDQAGSAGVQIMN